MEFVEVHEHLPAWLRGLRIPTYRDEVLELAEHNGAPEGALRFLRSLPAAVFTSEEGMRHVLGLLHSGDYERLEFAPTAPAEDGEPS